jgi:hypothetical protein
MGGFAAAVSIVEDAVREMTGVTGASVATWFLATIFAISGVTKLRRPALAAMAMVDFGVLRRFQPAFGRALGVAEISLALALAIAPRPSVSVAAVLLWGFALLIVRSLVAGDRFPCFCFGETDATISAWSLARTTALALLATGAALGRSPFLRPTDVVGALEFVVGVALLGTLVLAGQVRQLVRWNRDPLGQRPVEP